MRIIEMTQDTVILEMHADDAQMLARCCRAAQQEPTAHKWANLHNAEVSMLATLFEGLTFSAWAQQFTEGKTYTDMMADLSILAEQPPLASGADPAYNTA